VGPDFSPAGSASYATCVFIGIVVVGFGLMSLVVGLLVHAWRLWRLQKHEDRHMHERATWPLAAGPSRVVYGTVQVDDGSGVAVEIDIHQTVMDRTNKNARWHEWEESLRESRSKPFKLETAQGPVVAVEPGNDVLIVDSLATRYPDETPGRRVRAATVRQGESVYVYGDLHEGPGGGVYRGGSAFVLRPPRSGRVLVATEAMRDRYTASIRYLAACATLAFGVLGLCELMLGGFTLATFFGSHETAQVANINHYQTRSKSNLIDHWAVYATTYDGFVIRDEVNALAYAEISAERKRGESVAVPVVRTGNLQWASFIGTEPYSLGVWLLFSVLFEVAVFFFVLATYRSRAAWYDKKRVGEPGGTGHWIETRKGDGSGLPIDPSRN
jgi:hypothetical protein